MGVSTFWFRFEGSHVQSRKVCNALHAATHHDPSSTQEVERYNGLLAVIRKSCVELQKGIKGLVVMSADLDAIFDALANAKVPGAWLKTYPSLKPLGAWTRDLLQRILQLQQWISDTYPRVFWLSGFTYPTGFLTAVLQTTARKNSVPIDTLSFEFSIINLVRAVRLELGWSSGCREGGVQGRPTEQWCNPVELFTGSLPALHTHSQSHTHTHTHSYSHTHSLSPHHRTSVRSWPPRARACTSRACSWRVPGGTLRAAA